MEDEEAGLHKKRRSELSWSVRMYVWTLDSTSSSRLECRPSFCRAQSTGLGVVYSFTASISQKTKMARGAACSPHHWYRRVLHN